MGRTTEKFDEQLLAIKLLELPPLPRIDGSFFPTNVAIDSYPVSLRKRLEGIDRICREIWRGETVTPEFVREVLVRKVTIQIDIAEGESVTRSIATDLERWGPAWAYLAKEVGEIRSEFANRYEREIKGLVPAEQAPSSRAQNSINAAAGNTRQATTIGQNIDRLRKESGWSYGELAAETGIDKKLILSHVNKGARPIPRILREYAQAFSKRLERKITVPDLEK